MAAAARIPPRDAPSAAPGGAPARADPPPADPPHVPVLLDALMKALGPLHGTWLDGTFGAGGHSRALLQAGAERLIALDRDPEAIAAGAPLVAEFAPRLRLIRDRFSNLDAHGQALAGVLLDLGVSSMQLDRPERGFSFMRDGPLDMRMGEGGFSAADIVNGATEAQLADILHHYGEERAARRIARQIVKARAEAPITSTARLAEIVASALPPRRAGQSHPATRSFQALRIAVNDELGELVRALAAAERALAPGGILAVISFHSIEDRIVKRFLKSRAAGSGGGASRYAPEAPETAPLWRPIGKPLVPGAAELAANPRARSARLRLAERLEAPARAVDPAEIGLPFAGGHVMDEGEG